MNFFKIFVSLLIILLVCNSAYNMLEQEETRRQLRTSKEIVAAKILNLSCGKSKYIKFKLKREIISKRIYISSSECLGLKKQEKIKLKIGKKGNIVFANECYNDWSEMESISIILIAIFFIFCISWYSIRPAIIELKGKKK